MLQLDLNDLTSTHLEQCRPHLGTCQYASPCIIGTLIPPELRKKLDDGTVRDEDGVAMLRPSVSRLVGAKFIQFADDEQAHDALRMQRAFDVENWARVQEIASRYITP